MLFSFLSIVGIIYEFQRFPSSRKMNHFCRLYVIAIMKDHEIAALEQLADLMDSALLIPGTNIRIGLDSLIGLIPGIGDTITVAVSGYIIHKARKAGAGPVLLSRMSWNVFLDWLVGLVPFIGDAFDMGWKANKKNVELLKAHLKTVPHESDSKGHALFI
jgi:hypothetical protein